MDSCKTETDLSQGDLGLVEINLKSEKTEENKTGRLIHCSDGVIHEDELMDDEDLVDDWDWLEMMTLEGKPEEMPWIKWGIYKAARGVGHTLTYLESWGESVAKEFGITEPAYQDVIDMHNRIMEDAGEPITGLPEPLSDPVQREPSHINPYMHPDMDKC